MVEGIEEPVGVQDKEVGKAKAMAPVCVQGLFRYQWGRTW